MYGDAILFLDDPAASNGDRVQTVDVDHGRLETRRLRLTYDVGWLAARYDFPGIADLAEVVAVRETPGGKTTTNRRLYVLSRKTAAAAAFAIIRALWVIENRLH